MATGLVAMGATAESAQYVELASLCALMCAVLLVGARILRLGFIANFLSRSVLIGFLTGVGIQVAMGQFGGLFGVSEGSGTTLEKFANALKAIPTETSVPTLIVSIAVLVTIVGLERVNKKIPGALIAVVGAIAASYFFDLAARGVTDLGTVPGRAARLRPADRRHDDGQRRGPAPDRDLDRRRDPRPERGDLARLRRQVRRQLRRERRPHRARPGQRRGRASRARSSSTAARRRPRWSTAPVAGASSPSSTTGVVVLVVLLFLTGPLAYMPNAVLAAVVFLIGIRLIDYHGMADIYRLRQGEFAVAAITAATVVVVGVEQGIILAMALSVVEHIYHSYRPYDTLIGADERGPRPARTPRRNRSRSPRG